MGILLHSSAEVREQIELPFGVVSGIGPGIHLLVTGRRTQKGGDWFVEFLAFVIPLV